MIIHFGRKPSKGGRPPKDNRENDKDMGKSDEIN